MRAALLAALAACGGAAKPALEVTHAPAAPSPQPHAPQSSRSHLPPRPSLDLAIILPPHDPPWPLAEPPSVQPHLDVAMAHDACSDEFAKRHPTDADLLAYVGAWCRIRDDRSAVDELGKLARGARGDIARAARLDVVNLLADEGLPMPAISHLRAMGLGSIENLDLLAATYSGLGMRDEAIVVERRITDEDLHPSPVAKCERLLAWGKLDDRDLGVKLGEIDDRAGDCAKRARSVACLLIRTASEPRVTASCVDDEHAMGPEPVARLALARDYANWRDDWVTLVNIARDLEGQVRINGAEELVVSALEATLLSTNCTTAAVGGVHDAAAALLRDGDHSSRYDDRLHALVAAVSCKVKP
jgi:hypothetical protein